MNELYNRLYDLEDELDKLSIFKEIEEILSQIKSNKELMDKIEKYHLAPNEKLRMDIYSYSKIKRYKEKETDINLMILGMNQKMNEALLEKGDCHHESH